MASLLPTPAWSFCSALILLVVANLAAADEISFERQIRPMLTKHCGSCHGAEIQKSGLRLDAKSFAFRGGDSGPVINPGKPENSSLIERISSNDPGLRMPPKGPALSASEIELLRRWIANGAVWPETDYDRSATVDPRLEHWAWQPIKTIQPPTDVVSSNAPTSAITEIDRFILAELSKHQLDLSEPADRRTLIRRLSFDLLTGWILLTTRTLTVSNAISVATTPGHTATGSSERSTATCLTTSFSATKLLEMLCDQPIGTRS
jgi:mono/diheme cytochrome c family protein